MRNPLKDNPNWLVVRDRALVPAGAWARERRDWVVANDPVYGGLRRPGRTEAMAAAGTFLVLALIVVALMLFQWNWLRGPIGDWASARYDREIELNGDLDVQLFSWTPSAVVRGVRVGGPDWATEADTLVLPRTEVAVRLTRLFAGRTVIHVLSDTNPGDGFERAQSGLEDVYLATVNASRRAA